MLRNTEFLLLSTDPDSWSRTPVPSRLTLGLGLVWFNSCCCWRRSCSSQAGQHLYCSGRAAGDAALRNMLDEESFVILLGALWEAKLLRFFTETSCWRCP